MKNWILLITLFAFFSWPLAGLPAEESGCSTAALINALKKLDRREKVAQQGLLLWETDLKRLSSEAVGAGLTSVASKGALGIGIIAGGAGLAFLALDAGLVATGTVLMYGGIAMGSTASIGTLIAEQYAMRDLIKQPGWLDDTFSSFDKAHREIASQRQKFGTSRWKDFYTFGSATSRLSTALFQEAEIQVAVYKKELEFINTARRTLRDALFQGGCTYLGNSEKSIIKSVTSEQAISRDLRAPQGRAPSAKNAK